MPDDYKIDFSDWTPGPPMKVGDKITLPWPPPLTLWDKFLWRFFRIDRQKKWEMREGICIYTSNGSDANEQVTGDTEISSEK